MKKEVRIKDVAEVAGVSRAAVSLVMNNGKIRISDEKRQAILGAADKLGYRPNASARRLATGKTDTLGLVFPNNAEALSHYFLFELTHSIAVASKAHNYDLLLDFMTTSQLDATVIDSSRTDGMIVVFDRNQSPSQTGLLDTYHHPYMVIGGAFQENTPRNYVDADIESGGFAVTEHLIKLGHKNIAFVAGVHSPYKQKGYEDALRSANIEVREELVIECDMQEAKIELAVKSLLQKKPLPTAVVAANDTLAVHIIKILKVMDISVPEDISVVGFDDIEPARLFAPALTTISMPIREMSEYAITGLDKHIKNRNSEPFQKVLPVELIVRESSAPPSASSGI